MRAPALTVLVAGLLVALARGAPARADEEGSRPAVSVLAGWWSVEGEWRSRSGLFLAAGVPWPPPLYDNYRWFVPYLGRAGYQFPGWSHVKPRVSGVVAGVYGPHRCCEVSGPSSITVWLLNLGVRFESQSTGVFGGIDLSVYHSEVVDFFSAAYLPASLRFSQVYVGRSWY